MFPGEYFKSRSYFCKSRKRVWIQDGKLTVYFFSWIDFNCFQSLITLNLGSYSIHEIFQQQKPWKGFPFILLSVFWSLKGIVTYSQQYNIFCSMVSLICSRRTLSPSELAWIFKRICKFGLKIFRHGAVATGKFSFSIAFSWIFVGLNLTFFISRIRKRKVTSAKFFPKFPKYLILLGNYRISF